MCAISGFVNFRNKRLNGQYLKAITNVMAHRGPDDEGFFQDDHVSFGFKRLSIIDLQSGHQPMSNKDETIWIVFNGEIYNFPELRDYLVSKGYVFRTKADTEVIIHAYEEWGGDCVAKFNGMFAFALYDVKRKKVLIGRDQLGIKPLYYALVKDILIFASEMKSILAYPDFVREENVAALSSYLTFRYTQLDQSVFKGIKRLLPGHYMEVTAEGIYFKKYWEIPFHEKKEDLGETYYLKETKRLLAQSVKRQMVSDVPLGAFLSGGLDSSIVVALMSQYSNFPIKTFSIGFSEETYNEFEFAEKVGRYCKTEHQSILLSSGDYMQMLVSMIRQKDAPLSIPHEIALYKMCVELKKHITVVISGEGADELFGGYGRVQRSPMDFKKISFVQKMAPKRLWKPLFKMMGAADQLENWLKVKDHASHFFSVYHWMPFEEKWNLFTDDVNAELNYDYDLIEEWKKDFSFLKSGNPYDKILYLFEKRHLPCLLDRLDCMSMAAGVEARVPFVDHELVEFVSTIPIQYKLKWNSPVDRFRALFTNSFKASEKLDKSKSLLRQIGQEMLPHDIANRKKLGFPVPLDAWMKQGIMKQVKDILLDPVSLKRGIFKQTEIEHLLGHRQPLEYDFWGKKVWMLMNVELWFREFIDTK